MPYHIHCQDCQATTDATEIVDLIHNHTDQSGHFVCAQCHGNNTYIHVTSQLQEAGQNWERYIRAVVPIDTGVATYSPYIFLTADEENGPGTGLHFNYYKDVRALGGNLRHGHGPGGAPVLSVGELLQLLHYLRRVGMLTDVDLDSLRLVPE